jgi:two-component system sensor histidine kinase KdpD
MELIDLPVEELIDRMKDGKIYLPEQAERALVHFFKPGNLNALREMALRRTAVHVDTNVVALRGEKTWPVAERLLLAIGPSPYAQNLIRATKRLATQWEAEWCVLFVNDLQKDLEMDLTLGSRPCVGRTVSDC